MNRRARRALRRSAEHAIRTYTINHEDPPADIEVKITRPTMQQEWEWYVRIMSQREITPRADGSRPLRRLATRSRDNFWRIAAQSHSGDGYVEGKCKSEAEAMAKASYVKSLFETGLTQMLAQIEYQKLPLAAESQV